MARWLITGGAGFIGSHLVGELVRKGESVRVLDDFSAGRRENIAEVASKISVVRGDVREKKDVKRALKNIDYVLHQAAIRSVPRSLDDPIFTNDVNVGGTLMILWESLKAGESVPRSPTGALPKVSGWTGSDASIQLNFIPAVEVAPAVPAPPSV